MHRVPYLKKNKKNILDSLSSSCVDFLPGSIIHAAENTLAVYFEQSGCWRAPIETCCNKSGGMTSIIYNGCDPLQGPLCHNGAAPSAGIKHSVQKDLWFTSRHRFLDTRHVGDCFVGEWQHMNRMATWESASLAVRISKRKDSNLDLPSDLWSSTASFSSGSGLPWRLSDSLPPKKSTVDYLLNIRRRFVPFSPLSSSVSVPHLRLQPGKDLKVAQAKNRIITGVKHRGQSNFSNFRPKKEPNLGLYTCSFSSAVYDNYYNITLQELGKGFFGGDDLCAISWWGNGK